METPINPESEDRSREELEEQLSKAFERNATTIARLDELCRNAWPNKPDHDEFAKRLEEAEKSHQDLMRLANILDGYYRRLLEE